MIEGLPLDVDNHTLVSVAERLGTPIAQQPSTIDPTREGSAVHRVEALHKPHIGRRGQILSTGCGYFPLHTDEAFKCDPCRYVLLDCVHPDAHGDGRSIVVDARAVLSHSREEVRRLVQQPRFKWTFGTAAVIDESANPSTFRVRFRLYEMEPVPTRGSTALLLAQTAEQFAETAQRMARVLQLRSCLHQSTPIDTE